MIASIVATLPNVDVIRPFSAQIYWDIFQLFGH